MSKAQQVEREKKARHNNKYNLISVKWKGLNSNLELDNYKELLLCPYLNQMIFQ